MCSMWSQNLKENYSVLIKKLRNMQTNRQTSSSGVENMF